MPLRVYAPLSEEAAGGAQGCRLKPGASSAAINAEFVPRRRDGIAGAGNATPPTNVNIRTGESGWQKQKAFMTAWPLPKNY